MIFIRALFIGAILFSFSTNTFAQKELLILKRGQVVASFKEGDYLRIVLKKDHRHSEGHIVELYDYHMITSSDTIQFKDILKINIKKHRGGPEINRGIGGLLFLGGILYIGLDRLNNAIGVTNNSLDNSVLYPSLIATSAGAAMIFIRSKYVRLDGITYLKTVDYTSPFYQK